MKYIDARNERSLSRKILSHTLDLKLVYARKRSGIIGGDIQLRNPRLRVSTECTYMRKT